MILGYVGKHEMPDVNTTGRLTAVSRYFPVAASSRPTFGL